MSLLNQVLQDLDDRAPAGVRQPLRLATTPEAVAYSDEIDGVEGRDWLRIGIWAGVGIAVMLAAWVFHDADRERREPARVMRSVRQDAAPVAVPQTTVPNDPVRMSHKGSGQASRPPLPAVRELPIEVAIEPSTDNPAERSGPAADTRVIANDSGKPPAVSKARAETESASAQAAAIPQDGYLPLRNTEMPPPQPDRPREARRRVAVTAPVKTAKQPLTQPLEQVRDAIEQGELATAEYLLQQRLTATPQDRAARELLIGLMLRGERYADAMQQLDRALSHYPGHMKFVLIKARLLAQAGDVGAAVQLLEDAPASSGGTIEQLQMLGALYQQQSRYEDARTSYRALLNRDANSGPAWVGLAISLDGLGDAGALNAYARALRLGNLPAAAERYARQRVGQLETKGG